MACRPLKKIEKYVEWYTCDKKVLTHMLENSSYDILTLRSVNEFNTRHDSSFIFWLDAECSSTGTLLFFAYARAYVLPQGFV